MNTFYLFEPEIASTHYHSLPISDYTKSLHYILNKYLNNKGWDAKRYRIDNDHAEFEKNEMVKKFLDGDKSKLPIYLINSQVFHFGSYLELKNLKDVLEINDTDMQIIENATKKHLDELNDHSKDHLQDCACV